jgi:hypothetical protein
VLFISSVLFDNVNMQLKLISAFGSLAEGSIAIQTACTFFQLKLHLDIVFIAFLTSCHVPHLWKWWRTSSTFSPINLLSPIQIHLQDPNYWRNECWKDELAVQIPGTLRFVRSWFLLALPNRCFVSKSLARQVLWRQPTNGEPRRCIRKGMRWHQWNVQLGVGR